MPPPNSEYFQHLFRVSKHQIIWGGNYFDELPTTKAWIFWDKCVPEGVDFADGELAWTSGNKTLRKCTIPYSGFVGSEGKIHPTQKPVALYKWLLTNYAKVGDKILDTHLGSGSIAIACHDYGYDLTATELDKDYFEAASKRLKQHQSQINLFSNDTQSTSNRGASLQEARQDLPFEKGWPDK